MIFLNIQKSNSVKAAAMNKAKEKQSFVSDTLAKTQYYVIF